MEERQLALKLRRALCFWRFYKMTAKELAEMLSGRKYGMEITSEEAADAVALSIRFSW